MSAFGEFFVKSGVFPKEMGRNLNRAFEKRQLGDYESTASFDDAEIVQIINNAKDFIDAVFEWLEEQK